MGAGGVVKAEIGRNLGEMLEPFESSESNAGSVGVRTRGEGRGDAYGDVEYAARYAAYACLISEATVMSALNANLSSLKN